MRRLIKRLIKTFRFIVVFLIIIGWIFSGWPQIWNFPPSINEIFAAAPKVSLGDAADGSTVTVAPGSGRVEVGRFTLIVSKNAATASSITVTFPASVVVGIASVNIWNTADDTEYLSATSPTGDTFELITGTVIPITTSSVEYRIWITSLSHALMPVPNGVSYAATADITAYTTTPIAQNADTDSADQTVTIDNSSPNDATSTSGSVTSDTSITINWTTSSSTDYNRSIVLRWQSATTGSEVPAEGTDYNLNDVINSVATVACVENSGTSSTAYSGVDGSGTDECSAVALSSATQYSYKHFEKDDSGNWNTGVDNSNSPLTTTGVAPDPTFTQNTYLWYVDNDTANPTEIWGTPNIAENTAITIIPAGNDPPNNEQELRLRVNMTVNGANLVISSQQFQLQFKPGTDASCTTGSWTDVGAVGTSAWQFATSSVADGADITAVLSTTTSGKGEEYSITNQTQVNHVAANFGEVVEYDFHIIGSGSDFVSATQYSFRVIEEDPANTVFDAYTNCPTLKTEPGTENLLRHGNLFSDEVEQGFFWAN